MKKRPRDLIGVAPMINWPRLTADELVEKFMGHSPPPWSVRSMGGIDPWLAAHEPETLRHINDLALDGVDGQLAAAAPYLLMELVRILREGEK